MIVDILSIVINYTKNKSLLKLRLVNKKLKLLVYKFSKVQLCINIEKCNVITDMYKSCKLVLINCRSCYFTNKTLIKYKKNITTLILFNNIQITDVSIKHLKNLTLLDLTKDDNITDNSIKNLKNLTSLYLNKKITYNGIKNLKKLTSITLNDNRNLTDEHIKYFKNKKCKILIGLKNPYWIRDS